MPDVSALPIPIEAAREIADRYGYDQVVIIARKVGAHPEPHGEHVTTCGVDKPNCDVAAAIGDHLKHAVMRWPREVAPKRIEAAAAAIANARAGRRGAPPIENVLDVLKVFGTGKLHDEVMEDARAALQAADAVR